MEQTIKEETKITTLCRLVAVCNDMLYSQKQYDGKISVSVAYYVRLHVNKQSLYLGSLDGAISYIAVRMCELSCLPRVAVDVTF